MDVIAFQHRDFFIKQMECRLGLALTVSAGESRYPAVERILISRFPLSDEKAKEVIPLLKLEPMQETLIGKRDLIASGYGDLCGESDDADEYLSINESIIRRRNRWSSAREQAMIMAEIKRFSVADYVTLLTEKEDNCAYEILRYMDPGNPDNSGIS